MFVLDEKLLNRFLHRRRILLLATDFKLCLRLSRVDMIPGLQYSITYIYLDNRRDFVAGPLNAVIGHTNNANMSACEPHCGAATAAPGGSDLVTEYGITKC